MDHADHVRLIAPAVRRTEATWADVGAGRGAFTLALADLLAPGSTIVAIDRDAGDVEAAVSAVGRRFPEVRARAVVADFRSTLDLPPLDGLVMANALHFVDRAAQPGVVAGLAAHLRPDAPFVVVEYDAAHGNPWVPHPFPATEWPALAAAAGLVRPALLGRVPSRFLGAIYAAVAHRPSGLTRPGG